MTDLSGGSPTARRILLGSQLRKLRENRGISREEAGYHIRGSESKISRLELGRVSFKERDVADLLTYYGITDAAERAPLLELVPEANAPGWWQPYGDVLPSWFAPYIGLEEAATLIRSYEVQFVPGLLQTPDYARAVIAAGGHHLTPDVVERRVAVRTSRQRLLSRPNPPQLWVVLDEAALWRSIGGPAVMHAQLEHLAAMSTRPNITIQIMPFMLGAHVAECGAFTILRFPGPESPAADQTDVVYLEQLTGALFLDKPHEVDPYLQVMSQLAIASAPPKVTVATLTRIACKIGT
ncbi:helix-turn-helix domain-containing protein [Protofrankia coriariae]|uniref:XRE family transcriptional regulator n=1 Tax=Protofrankia coriariae TaxID=1562887 RepID=A0ABR5F2Q0_9ACTN|nr:helix-turn-helix transcriptional regulator [Protofrankia coriariae]KLL10923.1 XRE family transcriptional regulator [Protofrankia coriariae]